MTPFRYYAAIRVPSAAARTLRLLLNASHNAGFFMLFFDIEDIFAVIVIDAAAAFRLFSAAACQSASFSLLMSFADTPP